MVRACITCGVEKPHTTEFFFAHSKMKSGLLNRCKPCHMEISARNKARRWEATKANDRARYLRNKESHLRANRERYESRREDVRARQAQYRLENLARIRAKDREYGQANAAAARARATAWRLENPERARALSREKRQARPEKYREYGRQAAARRRAWKLGAMGRHTRAEFLLVLKESGSKCAYCAVALTEMTATEDHVVALSQGGSDGIENIVPACSSCNNRKNAQAAALFLEKARCRP